MSMSSKFVSSSRPFGQNCKAAYAPSLRLTSGFEHKVPTRQALTRTRRRQVHTIRAVATGKGASEKTETPKKPIDVKVKRDEKKLTPETARALYEDMYLGREFEERCAEMYYRGKMFGFVHLYSGQEAVSTGVISCLNSDDYVCSTYRDHVHALSKGVAAKDVMAELFGKKTGICRGQGGSMHMFSAEHNFLGGFAFIGEGIPIGVGAAFQTKYRKDVLKDDSANQVTCSFFGDGTCNNGQFYECMNMAGLYNLPHIFVVENNLWAIGMQHHRATSTNIGDHVPYIYKKGPAFGFPGVHVDGMDVLKVREVAMEAIERARTGKGPTLIECETYRYRGHSLADPDELRSKKEKEMYQARDPIPKFRKSMTEAGILAAADFDLIEKRIKEVVDEAVEFADKSPKPEKAQLLENVFADPKGFGIGEDGRYRFELPGFSSGSVQIS